MWQKERLLNIASRLLPSKYEYVAWLDADLIFENLDWANDSVKLLEEKPIIQVFNLCHKLPESNILAEKKPSPYPSFGSIAQENLTAGVYDLHGSTGYGWAMRREIFENSGLYDHAIIGGGDHFIAHGIFGDSDSSCIDELTAGNKNFKAHFDLWAKKFYSLVGGKVGAIDGDILHLWHGERENRQYVARHELIPSKFNPSKHIIANEGMPLEWANSDLKPSLANALNHYFGSRREDG